MVAALSKAEDTADGMSKFGFGQLVLRFEGRRLLTGEGRFIDDVNLTGQAYAVILRSLHANTDIVSIVASSARAAPGLLAADTGADVVADGPSTTAPTVQRKRPDGTRRVRPVPSRFVTDAVRYVGDPLAMVVA